MGSGKTSWAVNELLNKAQEENVLYITPYLSEIDRIKKATTRTMVSPENKGKGKIGNIAEMLNNQMDIASTHELFRRFDNKCKAALKENSYTLILDETLTAVEPYHFEKKDDYLYLLGKGDISVDADGLISWTGDRDLETRFDDVRTLADNKCLFKVDDKFFLWHFPVEIFNLFQKVYILTYLFDGSIMRYYFELYNVRYETKSISKTDCDYHLVDYYNPSKEDYQNRFHIYSGHLTENISQKPNMLSANWCSSNYNKNEIEQLRNNLYNFYRHIIKTDGKNVMWTANKKIKSKLSGKGYTNGFVACNARATNEYSDKTCLMYCVNWFENPEIVKFFKKHGIEVDQDATALSTIIQWVWRSNIRIQDSKEIISLYIPSRRMRELFTNWLNA